VLNVHKFVSFNANMNEGLRHIVSLGQFQFFFEGPLLLFFSVLPVIFLPFFLPSSKSYLPSSALHDSLDLSHDPSYMAFLPDMTVSDDGFPFPNQPLI